MIIRDKNIINKKEDLKLLHVFKNFLFIKIVQITILMKTNIMICHGILVRVLELYSSKN